MTDATSPGTGPALEGMLLAFDVDCGEIVPGRHLHLRGLRDEGHWPDELGNRLPDGVQGSWQMVSLDWEVLPPVRKDDADADKWFQHDLAEVQYRVEPPLDWDLRTASGVGGGSVDAAPGQPTSHGTYGPYPLSVEARQVSFTVFPYLDRRLAGCSDRGGTSYMIEGSQHALGQVVIDLRSRTTSWEPAAPASQD